MNASDILNDIVTNLKSDLGGGYSKIRKYAERQGEMLAKNAEFIAQGRLNGDFREGDTLYKSLLAGLADLTVNTARAIAQMTLLTLEKAWNALVTALWGGLRTILTGAGIPAPLIPAKPPKM